MKQIKLLIIPILLLLVCGCGLADDKKDRDKAIEECKSSGGRPIVENYDDSRYRPIVHCDFGGLNEKDN